MPGLPDTHAEFATDADGFARFLSLVCSPLYPGERFRGLLCGIGIRPLQHEIHSLRELVQRRTGRLVEEWNSPDELARMLVQHVKARVAAREQESFCGLGLR